MISARSLRHMRTVAPALVMAALVGCQAPAGAKAPERETARGAILTVARAVSVADEMCATIAQARRDKEIARTCNEGYKVARPALLAAEKAVDAWGSGERGNVACTLGEAAESLGHVADALSKAGVELPLVVVDALTLARAFGGICHGT